MKKQILVAMMICLVLSVSAYKNGKKNEPEKKKELTSGIDFTNLDTTANPADNFYQFACGGWMKKHPLTAEYSRFGSFDQLAEDNQLQLKDLIIGIAKQRNEKGSISQKISDMYNLGMDSVKLEKQNATPIQPMLQSIANMKNINELSGKLAELYLDGISPFFTIFGEADPKNSSMTIAWMWQTGLGIGDRDYYLSPKTKDIRDKYEILITNMFKHAGYGKMINMEGKEAELAKAVMKLEMEMAKAFIDKEALRDPHLTYNPKTVDELQKMIPVVDMKNYLTQFGLKDLKDLNVGQPAYITALNEILITTNINDIKAYLAWNVMNNAAAYLSDVFVNENFDFYGKTLSGKQENKPRWKRVVNTVDGALGEAVGQMYVEKYFPKEAKERMLKLVANLQAALSERIAGNTWMTAETKAKAQEKLSAFVVKIGYPDKWRDYSALNIENDSYYANIIRSQRFETQYQLSKIGKKVDPMEWLMTPQTVNAYYNPTTNEICFPAGILQKPFFDMNADDAFNYGAIGVVIGHEMTHGFDDQGRNYDKIGNLNDWWTKEDADKFDERTKILVDYFNKIEVLPGEFANGSFTLGENIADNGGLQVSYIALQKAIKEGVIKPEMDGFTPEQRFFIAYAEVWAGNIRDEEIHRRTKEDPHSLGKWRVNGTLPHIDAFAKAFKVKEGDKMYLPPVQRANIW